MFASRCALIVGMLGVLVLTWATETGDLGHWRDARRTSVQN